ncbi:MAG: imidazole glycerol phosphate synthase subunit HisH [Acidimicrobiales bacterium]
MLDYGIGNLRSAEKALQRVGADAVLTADPDVAALADGVVLPGVGSFGPSMRALRRTGLDAAAVAAVDDGRPFLGICVGLQLLYEGSEEDPEEAGLGVLAGKVVRLRGAPGLKRPQMQWNLVTPRRRPNDGSGGPLLFGGLEEPLWMYFVHSFAPEDGPATVGHCEYGGPVVAAVEKGPVWGTQFHPEKSGAAGLALLANFVAAVAASGGASAGTGAR